ncbi:MAG TPA: carboxypeptidase-like regulatory domain-containing protein [Terriglobia bacterium]|nr:carboxypeptidase-like regulatory domain-containing protein [Terriglobia bacterium]
MQKRSVASILGFAVVFGLLSAGSAFADVYGTIRGVVTDQSGAVIAGATVTITNTSTGIARTATTTADGSYVVVQLPAPATYTVKAESKGFKGFEASAVELGVDKVYVLNIEMEVGQVTQEVTVEAAANQVEKTSMELGATIGASQIVDMPLNGRNWIQLQQTMPGVVAQSDGRGNYATNGSQTDQNSFLVNGVDTNDLPLNTPLVIPSPDAIAEFDMVTNTINPEYGRNSGAILNAVTKSGSNSFHGSGFDFYRDTGLNTRNFFSPTSTIFHQNQFGGTVGGPIWKDHTFFFFSYQGTRNRIPDGGSQSVTVFTPGERNGVFPDVASSSAASPFPLTGENGTVYPAGTPYSTIFPTGSIPTADFNPISASLLSKYIPAPNSGTAYNFNPITTGKTDQYLTRIDHTFGSKDAIWGSWYWQANPTVDDLPFTGSTLPGFPETAKRHIQEYVAAWNHTFSPTTLNEARFGYTRFNFVAVQPVNVLNPQSVGFTGIIDQHPEAASWPLIDVSSSLGPTFSLGFSNNGPQPRIDQTYQVDENLTKILGRHTFKMGFNMRRFQVYNPFFGNINGHFTFAGSGTYSTGDGGADFLMGIPDSYSQSGGDIINARAQEYYSYFQDQFRVRRNFTLTYGTGWSVDTPLVDIYHANHALVAFRPGQQSTIFTNAPLGYVFQGDPGVNAAGTTKYGHFGPRLGFAWSPGQSGKWSIRAGWGIYFNRSLEEQTLQFLGDPPYSVGSAGVADAGGGLSPGFATPFTDIAGKGSIPNKFPLPSNPPSNVPFGQFEPINFLMVMDPNTSVPYAENFNLTLERQLPGSALASLAYVGAQARHLVIVREMDPGINPAGCAADPSCVANRVVQSIAFPNNFPLDGNVFSGVANNQTTGISNYNSLQATFTKRLSHGLQFFATYTYSKAMDDGSGFENSAFGGGGFGGYGSLRATNPFNQSAADYGPSVYDATHRFVISYTYEFPAIHHFNNWAAKRLVEGWRMSGVTALQSGFALDVIDAGFRSLTCDVLIFSACWDVPNVVGPAQYGNPRTDSFVNATKGGTTPKDHYWFNPNTFSREAFGTIGNAGRSPLRGPGINNFDWGFFKDTAITERTRLELRFEFFNLFNHTQFSDNSISTNINSGNFGRILSAQPSRIIQLAAKVYF